MTISHMTRCPSLKPWMLAAGTSQLMIAKGGSDIPGGFIPGASPWITSDVMFDENMWPNPEDRRD